MAPSKERIEEVKSDRIKELIYIQSYKLLSRYFLDLTILSVGGLSISITRLQGIINSYLPNTCIYGQCSCVCWKLLANFRLWLTSISHLSIYTCYQYPYQSLLGGDDAPFLHCRAKKNFIVNKISDSHSSLRWPI